MKRVLLVAWLTIVTTTLLGGFLFSLVERVSFFTGCYFALTTAATVGYGDVVPKNDAGRLLAMGIMLIAIPAVAWAYAQLTSHLSVKRMGHTHDMHQILADLHLHVTGEEHPRAPKINNGIDGS